jgi:flagellar motor switch protein FliM
VTSTAPAVSPEVRLHDFRTAAPLSADRAAAMQAFRSRFAGSLRALLTPQVREVVDADAGTLTLLSADQATQHFTGTAIRFRFALGDGAGSTGVLELTPELGSRIVDRLCGGADDGASATRQLSAIEQSLLGELLSRALPLLAESISGITTIAPTDLSFCAAVDTAWLARSGDHVVVASLTVRCGPNAGECAIVLPLGLVGAAASTTSATAGDNDVALVEQHILTMAVPVSVRVGCRVPALTIAALRVGTVIPTGHQLHGPVELSVGGRKRFVGMLGRDQDHVAVRVLRASSEDDTSTIRPNRRN